MRRLAVVSLAFILAVPLLADDKPSNRITVPQFTLSASFVGLSIADTAITIYGTSRLGLVEMNGFMRPFLENERYLALWAVQAAGCAAIIGACHLLIHGDSRVSRIAGYALLVAANIGRAYIVYHNLRLHAKVSK